jgi:hypothetical protein
MALFKRVYTTINPKTGRKVKRRTAKWYGQYRDPAGHIHRVPLATDKVAAAQKLADLVKRAERQRFPALPGIPAEEWLRGK